MNTERFSEGARRLDSISPVSSSTVVNGAWVSVAGFEKIVALIEVGVIAATGTVDAAIQQATSAAGADPKAIGSGKAITQLADTADNTSYAIEVRADELDVDNDFTFVRLSITPATAAALISGTLLGVEAHFKPTTHNFDEVIA